MREIIKIPVSTKDGPIKILKFELRSVDIETHAWLSERPTKWQRMREALVMGLEWREE